MTINEVPNKIDVLIVGGGMVGLAMASSLLDSGLQIALLEKSDFESLESGDWLSKTSPQAKQYDLRVSAISPGNQGFLQSIGIWDRIPANRKSNYDWMRVWDADGSGSIAFDAAELAQPFLGTIVENQVIRAAAYANLQHRNNFRFIENETIVEIDQNESSVEVVLSSGKNINCQLLIGADGALSSVRQKLGITSADVPYDQIAFVANVETELPHQQTAWQRFTPTGPVAFLPLPEKHLCSVVWSIDSDKAQQLQNLEPQEFAEKLGFAFENRLGKVTAVSPFTGFPLIKRHSERYLSNRCVLVGDAAHTIHPLAGQGVNLGFQDVACLSGLMLKLKNQHRDWSLMSNLRPYERERRAENSVMQNAMSGFKWLFGQSNMAPVLMRNFALNLANRSGPIKQEIIRRAMGL